MIRGSNIDAINQVVNHPMVRPWCGGDAVSEVDMSVVVTDGRTVTCNYGNGFLCFIPLGHNTWEVHCAFAPEAWGFRAFRCAREARDYMFREFGAETITGRPQSDNTRTARFCELLGMSFIGQERVGGDMPYDATVYEITKGKWLCLQQQLS